MAGDEDGGSFNVNRAGVVGSALVQVYGGVGSCVCGTVGIGCVS